MAIDLRYHAFEKVGDYGLSAAVVTAFPAGAAVGFNADGGIQVAQTANNVIGLAKVTRAQMAAAGPGLAGGAVIGSASFVSGICIAELYDGSAIDPLDGAPYNAASLPWNEGQRVWWSAAGWTNVDPGAGVAPHGYVIEAANSEHGGPVVYFNIVPRA